MTTTQIANLADFEQHGGVNFPIQEILREKIIPDYFNDVGQVGWRKSTDIIPVGPGARIVTLPAAIGLIKNVFCDGRRLVYIGDHEAAIEAALATKTPQQPSTYWVEYSQKQVTDGVEGAIPELEREEGPVGQRDLKLGAPVDAICELQVTGWIDPWFVNYTAEVDMNAFMPRKLQFGLVEGLRYYIFRDRLGVGDPRSINARAEYDNYVQKGIDHRDVTVEETPRFG